MIHMKTNELTGAALDWAVAKCEGAASFGWTAEGTERTALLCIDETWRKFKPSTDWAQGGPIIEKGQVSFVFDFTNGSWCARIYTKPIVISYDGPTPLIAAMRCYVASKLGDTIEIPEELTI